MDETELKKELFKLFEGGGTNGCLWIDLEDAEYLNYEIHILFEKMMNKKLGQAYDDGVEAERNR